MDAGFPPVKGSLPELPDGAVRELAETARLAALGELAPGIVHELNNPLFAVLGLVELLLADAEPESAEAERLRLVHSTGLELRDAIRGLAEFVRDDGAAAPADLRAAADAAARLLRQAEPARHASEPLPVAATPAALRRLVLHVLLEARRGAPERTRLALETGRDGDDAVLRARGGGDAPGLGLLVARLLAADLGGSLESEAPWPLVLRLPLAPG